MTEQICQTIINEKTGEICGHSIFGHIEIKKLVLGCVHKDCPCKKFTSKNHNSVPEEKGYSVPEKGNQNQEVLPGRKGCGDFFNVKDWAGNIVMVRQCKKGDLCPKCQEKEK